MLKSIFAVLCMGLVLAGCKKDSAKPVVSQSLTKSASTQSNPPLMFTNISPIYYTYSVARTNAPIVKIDACRGTNRIAMDLQGTVHTLNSDGVTYTTQTFSTVDPSISGIPASVILKCEQFKATVVHTDQNNQSLHVLDSQTKMLTRGDEFVQSGCMWGISTGREVFNVPGAVSVNIQITASDSNVPANTATVNYVCP